MSILSSLRQSTARLMTGGLYLKVQVALTCLENVGAAVVVPVSVLAKMAFLLAISVPLCPYSLTMSLESSGPLPKILKPFHPFPVFYVRELTMAARLRCAGTSLRSMYPGSNTGSVYCTRREEGVCL